MSDSDGYEFKDIGARLSNWGRWGEGDQIGTLNFITPSAILGGLAVARRGALFDLGMEFGSAGPQPGPSRTRFNPIHRMTRLLTDDVKPDGLGIADDMVVMPLQCATQWDALSHVGYDGFMYNGVSAEEVNSIRGAERNSISAVATRIVGRGVLVDIAALHGVDSLAERQEVRADDLEAACARQYLSIRPGDILLVRTGWYRHFLASNNDKYMSFEAPGLDISTCEWLYEHEVAALGCDNWAVEARSGADGGAWLPVHSVLIRDMGMTIGEMFNLEDLAADCRTDGVFEFFFCGSGLKFANAVGAPASPIAIK